MAEESHIKADGGLADLHIHTVNSDGSFTPLEVVERAAAVGLKAIGITDHDAIAGIPLAQKAGQAHNLEVIPGIELSSVENDNSIHMLGYFIEIENKKLNSLLELFYEERIGRARRITDKLRRMGIGISFESVCQKAEPGPIGRPHIAQALLEGGFVLSYEEAFVKYLATGRPAFEPNYPISPQEAIQVIHEAGGISFIAHPDYEVLDGRLGTLIKSGLDGIEILHPRFGEPTVRRLYNLAIEKGLLVSGGSDFHGGRDGLSGIGKHTVPYRFVEEMKQKMKVAQTSSTIRGSS